MRFVGVGVGLGVTSSDQKIQCRSNGWRITVVVISDERWNFERVGLKRHIGMKASDAHILGLWS
jgi:hypothetical protein